MKEKASTKNSKIINASSETIYKAFTDPEALAVWLAPANMTGKVHSFDPEGYFLFDKRQRLFAEHNLI